MKEVRKVGTESVTQRERERDESGDLRQTESNKSDDFDSNNTIGIADTCLFHNHNNVFIYCDTNKASVWR